MEVKMNCRLCLIDCCEESRVSIFHNDEEAKLNKIIAKHLNLEITQQDAFSTIICQDCFQHLNEFHNYFLHVEEQQQVLQDKCTTDFECLDESFLDIKDFRDDESVSVELELDCASDHFDTESVEEAVSDEDSPLKSLLENEKNKETKRKKDCLDREESQFEDDILSKHLQLICEICNESVQTYNDLKTHFRKEHKRKAFITCCGTRYLRRFLLWDHIQCHVNPDHFKCKICKKVLKSRSSFQLHMANKHMDRNEMKHECNICNKKFPFLSVLNSHMIVHSDETNHACKHCGKGFKTKYMLKLHMNHVHEKKPLYICETCGKEYRFKQSFDRHVAEHIGKRNEPTEQCKICGQWLRYNCLRRHMQRHENKTFKCEICNKICNSKSSLTSHISYCHKMKQMHSCNLCGKTFKRPLRLKEHLAMHTGEKDYSCPHCSREFRSSANMYVHIKKIHVDEWTKAQKARNQCPKQQLEGAN